MDLLISISVSIDDFPWLIYVNLPSGSTLRQAIDSSSVLKKWPHLQDNLAERVGIYSQKCSLDTTLTEDCRVEIYTPITNYQENRRQKAARLKKRGSASTGNARR